MKVPNFRPMLDHNGKEGVRYGAQSRAPEIRKCAISHFGDCIEAPFS